jgi:hypothetical protein
MHRSDGRAARRPKHLCRAYGSSLERKLLVDQQRLHRLAEVSGLMKAIDNLHRVGRPPGQCRRNAGHCDCDRRP